MIRECGSVYGRPTEDQWKKDPPVTCVIHLGQSPHVACVTHLGIRKTNGKKTPLYHVLYIWVYGRYINGRLL